MSTQSLVKVGLLLGSTRVPGNNLGIHAWLVSRINKTLLSPSLSSSVSLAIPERLGPFPNPNPTAPPIDVVPASVKTSSGYSSPITQKWSEFVYSCKGFIVLSPEYNSGYPGELKQALDSLFLEWNGKSAMVITYGAKGGLNSSGQLKQILGTGLRMEVWKESVEITLPGPYIMGPAKVYPNEFTEEGLKEGEESAAFLKEYEETVDSALEKFFIQFKD